MFGATPSIRVSPNRLLGVRRLRDRENILGDHTTTGSPHSLQFFSRMEHEPPPRLNRPSRHRTHSQQQHTAGSSSAASTGGGTETSRLAPQGRRGVHADSTGAPNRN